jgi:hypothetical protein
MHSLSLIGIALTPGSTSIGKTSASGQALSITERTAATLTGFFEPTAIFLGELIGGRFFTGRENDNALEKT